MSKENPLKIMLMGDLSVLKNDDPSLIDEFIQKFRDISCSQSPATEMMFIRACHYNAVNVVDAMIRGSLISSLDLHDYTCQKAALKNDSEALIKILKANGGTLACEGQRWLSEACTQGAIKCIPTIIEAIIESGNEKNLAKLLDIYSVQLVQNSMKKSSSLLIKGLEILKEHGATLSGSSENLLANAVLAHRNSDMLEVVEYILERQPSEQAIRAAKSALSTLINDMKRSFTNGRNHVDHFKAMREKIELAAVPYKSRIQRHQTLASLS